MPTYYKRNINPTNNNWNQANNWSTVSSTSAVNIGTFPSSTTLDPVIFDANSIGVTVNVASQCTSLDFTSYAATITMTSSITVYGNITLGVSMVIAGTGTLAIQATSTYTSNGVTWPNTLSLQAFVNITVTLASLITTVQNLSNTGSSGGNITTVNGNTLNILGNLTMLVILAGSTQVNLTGTGTWNASAEVRTKLNIDTLGTITRGVNGYAYSGTELKYTQGTLANSSTNLVLSNGGNSTVISNGANWGNVQMVSSTITLSDNMTIDNLLVQTTNVILNGSNLKINGNISITNINLSGTTVLQIIGTGNQTWTSTTGGRIATSLNIDKPSGTFTLSSANISYGSGTLTYTRGTFDPGTSTFLTPVGGVTFNILALGFTLNNFTPTGLPIALPTYTINTNPLIITGNLTLSGTAFTFEGTRGWTCANLLCSSINCIIILQNSVTYTTTTSVNMLATAANPITMRSNTPTVTRAIWTLNQGATQSIVYVNGQGLDSNAGQTIWTFGGVITTALVPLNWNVGARPAPYGFISFS